MENSIIFYFLNPSLDDSMLDDSTLAPPLENWWRSDALLTVERGSSWVCPVLTGIPGGTTSKRCNFLRSVHLTHALTGSEALKLCSGKTFKIIFVMWPCCLTTICKSLNSKQSNVTNVTTLWVLDSDNRHLNYLSIFEATLGSVKTTNKSFGY